MRWQNRPVLAVLALGSILILAMGAALTWPAVRVTAPRDPVLTSVAMDRNRNKVFDELERDLGGRAAGKRSVPVIVVTRGGFDPGSLETVAGEPVLVEHVYRHLPGFSARLTPAQVQALAREPWVRQIEPDRPVRILMDSAARDFGADLARADFGVDGDRDGDPSRYSRDDVVVAVIDTGIDPGHLDLQNKVIAWRDWVNGRTEPYDDNGHGTHVAGIAAGAGRADARYRGVAPGAALIGLKVLNAFGTGSLSDVTAAVDWCIEHKAEYNIRVISMSLGTTDSSDGTDSLSLAVNRAVEAGIAAVVAAGNSGPAARTVGSPGAAERAITVGAMADTGELGFYLAPFSSRGPTRDGRLKPEVVAPGVNITAPRAGTQAGYATYSGTSMATPYVSGTVALMLDAAPSLTPAEIRDILLATSHDWGPAGQDVDYGRGRLDAYAAVRQAAGGGGGGGPAVPGHHRFQGTLTAPQTWAEHVVTVTDAGFPLAATLIMPGWTGRSAPDFDLYVYAPNGAEIGRATGVARQETVKVRITQTGDYRLRIYSYAGTGDYLLDVSAGPGAAPPPPDLPPAAGFAAPAEGAEVVGTVEVRVAATDDRGIARVEVAVDQGGWTDITGSRDGDHYIYIWDTTEAGDGPHTLTARVTDTAGQTALAQRQVTVANRPWVYEKVSAGEVSPTARDAWLAVEVGEPGYLDLTLHWDTPADLDFFVYAPNGQYVGRAYTLRNPEQLRVRTEDHGTGTYRIRVNLYGGGTTPFRLVARGLNRTTYMGSVSSLQRDSVHVLPVSFAGPGQWVLSWDTGADLDIYIYDPSGALRGRGFTLLNPEVVELTLDATGEWRARVNLYSGPPTAYTLRVYAPAAVVR